MVEICQQSAEKMLKAFWLYSDVFPPKTHALELLRNKCEAFNATFIELVGECIRLNDYSSQPRYPFNLEITDEDMLMAKMMPMLMAKLIAKMMAKMTFMAIAHLKILTKINESGTKQVREATQLI